MLPTLKKSEYRGELEESFSRLLGSVTILRMRYAREGASSSKEFRLTYRTKLLLTPLLGAGSSSFVKICRLLNLRVSPSTFIRALSTQMGMKMLSWIVLTAPKCDDSPV